MWTLAEFLRQVHHSPGLLERGWRVRLNTDAFGGGYPDIAMTQNRWVVTIPEMSLRFMVDAWSLNLEGSHPSLADIDLGFLQHRAYTVPEDGWVVRQSGGRNVRAEPIKLEPQSFRPDAEDSFFIVNPVTGSLVAVSIGEPHQPEIAMRVPNTIIDNIREAWQASRTRNT